MDETEDGSDSYRPVSGVRATVRISVYFFGGWRVHSSQAPSPTPNEDEDTARHTEYNSRRVFHRDSSSSDTLESDVDMVRVMSSENSKPYSYLTIKRMQEMMQTLMTWRAQRLRRVRSCKVCIQNQA